MQRRAATSCTSCQQSGRGTASTWTKWHWSWSSNHWSATVTLSAPVKTITLRFNTSTVGWGPPITDPLFVTWLIAPQCERPIWVNHMICIFVIIMSLSRAPHLVYFILLLLFYVSAKFTCENWSLTWRMLNKCWMKKKTHSGCMPLPTSAVHVPDSYKVTWPLTTDIELVIPSTTNIKSVNYSRCFWDISFTRMRQMDGRMYNLKI